MPDLTALPDARLHEEREQAAGLVLSLKCRLLRNLSWQEHVDSRQHLNYAQDRLALAESEIARRRLDE